MQLIFPSNGAGTYTLSSFNLGVNFTTGTEDDYGVILDIWTGVNTSATAANALAGATDIEEISGTLSDPAGSGNYTYTFTLNNAATLAIPATGIAVQFQLTDAANDAYSDDLNGRFSAVAPTAGTSPGYVWNDANSDGIFAGSEQTTFGQTGAYARLSLTGTAPVLAGVPEPGTYALCGLGLAAMGTVVLRRRTARA